MLNYMIGFFDRIRRDDLIKKQFVLIIFHYLSITCLDSTLKNNPFFEKIPNPGGT